MTIEGGSKTRLSVSSGLLSKCEWLGSLSGIGIYQAKVVLGTATKNLQRD